METVECLLCGTSKTVILLTSRDPDGISSELFVLRKCQLCGLIYVSPRPTKEEISAYYPNYYPQHQEQKGWLPSQEPFLRREIIFAFVYLFYNMPPQGEVARSLASSLALLRTLLKFVFSPFQHRIDLLPHYQSPGRLLDVGCGAGGYLDTARDFGWQAVGVDISQDAVNLARSKGHQAFIGSLDQMEWNDAYFQAASFWHSLEHLHNPLNTLKRLHRFLSPGAELLLEVPNGEAVSLDIFGSDWFALQLPRHLYFFTPATIVSLLKRAGFRPVSVRTVSLLRTLSALRVKRFRAEPGVLRLRQTWSLMTRQWMGRGDLIKVRAVRI